MSTKIVTTRATTRANVKRPSVKSCQHNPRRDDAAPLRAKQDKSREFDKMAISARIKDKTATRITRVAKKALIATDDSNSNRPQGCNWKVPPVNQPSRRLITSKPPLAAGKSSQIPRVAAQKQVAAKPDTITTTSTTSNITKRPAQRKRNKEEQVAAKPDTTSNQGRPDKSKQNEEEHPPPGIGSVTELEAASSISQCSECSVSQHIIRDPQLCGEYVDDIFNYLRKREMQQEYIVREGFLDHQIQVKVHHRRVLVDWLVQVQEKFCMLSETLHIGVDILDRYLQVCTY